MSETKPTRAIELSLDLQATPQEVWNAIAEADGIVKWFTPEARVTPGAGGEIWLSWGGEMSGASKIEIWEPGKHLRTLEAAHPGMAPKVIDWYIETAEGGSTRLRLVHSGFGADAKFDGEYDSTTGGWTTYLLFLENWLNRHRGESVVTITESFIGPMDRGDAWHRLLGPEGFCAEGSFKDLKIGDRFEVRTASGDRFHGTIRRMQAPGYIGFEIDEWNGALHAMSCEGCGPGTTWITFQTSFYGSATEQSETVRTKWKAMLNGLFAPPAAAGA